MGRKNHKGRQAGQNPRRFYREKNAAQGEPHGERPGRNKRRRPPPEEPEIDIVSEPAIDSALEAFVDGAFDLGAGAGRAEPELRGLTRTDDWDQREIPSRQSAPGAVAGTCGRCAEWVPRRGLFEATARGECLHPGSGVLHPPAAMDGCDFYH
ncbi:MAG: hypothetical protein DK306_000696 [Chloroflexi bacterium]|jgi:hypothetical protein|nr:MAG: hypothetical protein DK306_000696 [Chloroflexota bacterium]